MTPIQATPRKSLSRRALLGLAGGAVLLPVATAGGTARADGRSHRTPDPVGLPVGFRPEGITSGPGARYYAGSMADGRIVTGNLLTGSQATLLPPLAGRAIRGLYWDRRTELVWAVGNVGTVPHVWAVDGWTGNVAYDAAVPDGKFLNDVVVTDRQVVITDSLVDRLTLVALDRRGNPAGSAPTFVALGGAWPAGDGVAINANGIRELPDGSLVLNNSRVGGLWQVDARTGTARQLEVRGGPALTGGDGLEIDGRTLFDVRATGQNAVEVLRLRRNRGTWSAVWDSTLTDPTLDVPSTATFAGDYLWAVNARFGNTSPTSIPYSITPLRVR